MSNTSKSIPKFVPTLYLSDMMKQDYNCRLGKPSKNGCCYLKVQNYPIIQLNIHTTVIINLGAKTSFYRPLD